MSNIKNYKTGMWIVEEDQFFKQKFNGKGWSLSFEKEKTSFPKIYNGKEIIVNAKNWKTAQQAINLIFNSLTLVLGYKWDFPKLTHPFAYLENDEENNGLPNDLIEALRGYHIHTPDLSTACLIALKAGQKKILSSAIAKYNLSCEIYSTASIDLDPFHSQNLKLSPFIDDHVRFAISISLAYSVIENVGLQIKASIDNPSRLKNGDWNPIVKQDLEERLTKAGIDLLEPFLWCVRGTPRKLDKNRSPNVLSKVSWTNKSVRDVEVKIIDAINDASWLRSKISTHGYRELTASLSPYDVANVQNLARRVILEILGFWRK